MQGRSRLTLGQQACMVVDMMQVSSKAESSSPASSPAPFAATDNTVMKGTPTRILDPATRELERGILLAIQRADFNLISSALIKGASPSYQLSVEKGGYTALMASAMKGNVRMVKRLLLSSVDVTARSQQGFTALDLLQETSQNRQEMQEIRHLLQSALIKHYQAPSRSSRRVEPAGKELGEFVVDLFCTRPDLGPATSAAAGDASALAGQEDSSMELEATVRVSIEGLRILADGQVELLGYDSDWSDLADDEDPDSNDERYAGNDYPEDEESDQEGLLEGDEAGRDSDEEDNLTDPTDPTDFRHHPRQTAPGQSQGASLYDDIAYGDEDDDVPLFERARRVGKVMRSHVLGPQGGLVSRPQDTEALQELWGMDTAATKDMSSREERIEQMRLRTGMVFAANSSEFLDNGLPKYGMELSDDEGDEDVLYNAAYEDRDTMARSTVAYDAELDDDNDEYD